ncbi:class I SAM-dependent methyltransferase [Methylocapsa acidiphila]|uniref:class I SAM-dependent methyltransferase n=1 Tax=Methylocapsa acidiphila TaxID=133552 RepID=UPI0003F76FFD|nr:class I SAM-dependent methyltransferase [Methylocapsa acidiphila]
MSIDRRAHWDRVYGAKAENELSWFEESPAISLDLIHATGIRPTASIIDVGGGESRLVDALCREGFKAVTVLDISEKALAAAKARLGPQAAHITWIVADITVWEPFVTYDLWHDRATFHFLVEWADRLAYAERVAKAVPPGGHVIIGAFALDGPERCSGLPVQRHDSASIGAILGDGFALYDSRRHEHVTPSGVTQRFQFSCFRRLS